MADPAAAESTATKFTVAVDALVDSSEPTDALEVAAAAVRPVSLAPLHASSNELFSVSAEEQKQDMAMPKSAKRLAVSFADPHGPVREQPRLQDVGALGESVAEALAEDSVGAGVEPLEEDPVSFDIGFVFTRMEMRKIQRRWSGFRSQAMIMGPLFNLLIIYLLPILIFEVNVKNTYVCEDRVGRTFPCLLGNQEGRPLSNQTALFITAPLVEDGGLVFLAVNVFASWLLLYLTGSNWIFRRMLYILAIGYCSLRMLGGLCQNCIQLYRGNAFDYFALGSFVVFYGTLLYMRYVLPIAARKGWLRFRDVRLFYRIRLLADDLHGDHKYSYSPTESPIIIPLLNTFVTARYFTRRAICTFSGDLDERGRPHGFGSWRDTQGKGETLKGFWRHGVPVGPFVASEQGSGFAFRAVQIGFATCCADASVWDETKGASTAIGTLQWGLAATETSISGAFYVHLPESTLLCGPEPERDAAWVLSQMQTMRSGQQTAVVVTATGSFREDSAALSIAGHAPMAGASHESVTIELSVDDSSTDRRSRRSRREAVPTPSIRLCDWQPSSVDALVFIHGWTAGHKNSHQQLAQFLNLSALGPQVKPFVFAWPCGLTPLSFPRVVKLASTSAPVHAALAAFIASIAQAGIRRVHILAHSMGVRLLCSALPTLMPHLRPVTDKGTTGQGAAPSEGPCQQVELSTCTLLHPEHDLLTFVQRDYPLLRQRCGCITLYMDRGDTALAASEIINRTPSLGKHPFALVDPAHMRQDGKILAGMPASGRAAANGTRSGGRARIGHAERSITRHLRGYSQRSELTFKTSDSLSTLDVDVIDISWMDVNAHGPRHNYFSVNRWLVDDLAEIISTRKRAAHRPHRLIQLDADGQSRRGNVWVFLAAPSWIGA